jgi:WD40 repeat protein
MATVIDPAKVRLLRTVAKENVGFWCGALDEPGSRLFVGGTDFQIHVYELPGLQPAKVSPLKGHSSYVTALVRLPGRPWVISGGFDKQLIWWDLSAAIPMFRQAGIDGRVNHLAVSADGRLLGIASSTLTAQIWDAQTGKPLLALQSVHPATTYLGRQNTVYCIAFSPDAKQVATGDRAGTIVVWDVPTGKARYTAVASAFYSQAISQNKQASEYEWGGVRSLAFTPDGKILVAGGMGPADQNSAGIDGPMRLEAFDAENGKSRFAFMSTPKGMLTTMLLHPKGDWLLAAGGGGQAGSAGIGSLWLWNPRLLDKERKPVPPVMHATEIVVRGLLVTPDGKSLLAVGMQRDLTAGRIQHWELSGKASK